MCASRVTTRMRCILAVAAISLLMAWPSAAQTYFNDFEDVLDPLTEWSLALTDTTPAGERMFLGQFGNDAVSLTLPFVPASNVALSFDLFIIHSWDGHAVGAGGPDIWDLSVEGGPTLCHTTFATHEPRLQAYPGTFVAEGVEPLNDPHTGAVEINSLGFDDFFGTGDVYSLSFIFPHTGGELVLRFSGSNLQEIGDESWGLDNVLVNCPPDCSNAAPSIATLWPVNHKFVPITIVGVTDPDGDPVTITIDSIYQDEPVNVIGSGNSEPDGKGVGTDTAEIRAERSGTKKVPGNGRVYHITFTADDGVGGTCTGTVTVCVPHDNAHSECVDDGPLYDSTVP